MMIGSLLLVMVRIPAILFQPEILKIFVDLAPLLAGLFAIPALVFSVFVAAILLRGRPPYRFRSSLWISLVVAIPLTVVLFILLQSNMDDVSLPELILAWGGAPALLSAGVAVLFLRTLTRFGGPRS